MGIIRNFIHKFLKNDVPAPPRHDGHDLAQNIRDAVGPVSGAESGGGAAARGGAEAVLRQAAKGKQRGT